MINPCLYPSVEIPKLCSLADKWIKKISTAEKILYTHITGLIRQTTFAIFSNNDELFSYKTVFDEIYGASGIKSTKNFIAVEGTHYIPPQSLELGLAAAMEYSKKLASVVSLWQLYSCEGGGAVCYTISPTYDIIYRTFFLYRRSY